MADRIPNAFIQSTRDRLMNSTDFERFVLRTLAANPFKKIVIGADSSDFWLAEVHKWYGDQDNTVIVDYYEDHDRTVILFHFDIIV